MNSKTTLFDAGVHLPLILYRPGQRAGVANPNLVSFTDILPTFLDWARAGAETGARRGRTLLPLLEATALLPGWQEVFGSHSFHEITNYWPTRFLRTPRWKYHRNIAWQLPFPFAADLWASLSWQEIRRRDAGRLGGRALADYIHRPAEELYDLANDPLELQNLAAEPDHARVLADLRARMDRWQRDTRDPWLTADGLSERALAYLRAAPPPAG